MNVRFGVWDHFERRPDLPLDRQYQEKIVLLQEAEQLGFVGYHIAEHHLSPLDLAPSPNVFLAALAQATTRLRVGTMVYIMPLYHPVRLVQEICMLDNLSGGRLDVGVGRGIRAIEHAWFGINPSEARGRTEEILRIMVDAMCSGNLEHSGTYYQIPEARLDTLPMQRPYPPLWYAGGVEFAAQHGLNYLGRTADNVAQYWELYDAQRAAGGGSMLNAHLPSVTAGIQRQVVVRASDEEAIALARRAWEVFQDNFNATSVTLTDGRVGHGREDFDAVLREGSRLLVGTPARVREFLEAACARLDGRSELYFAPAVQWGDLTLDESRETMQLLATEVMPAFKSAGA